MITKLSKARLQKLITLYRPAQGETLFPEAIASLIHRHQLGNSAHNPIPETKLFNPQKPLPTTTANGTWAMPDALYDALHICLNIQRVLHCNSLNLPLRAKIYISHNPLDAAFGALLYT